MTEGRNGSAIAVLVQPDSPVLLFLLLTVLGRFPTFDNP